MSNQPTQILQAIDFLKAHPEYHAVGGKRLSYDISEPNCSYGTWNKARKALGLPPVPRFGMTYRQHMTPKSAKQERKAAFAVYPNTHKIVVDTRYLKIVFHGDNGFKVTEKKTAKALSASLRLFRLAKFETRSYDLETGIMILTLKPEAVRRAA